jgi:hypothetical protein
VSPRRHAVRGTDTRQGTISENVLYPLRELVRAAIS